MDQRQQGNLETIMLPSYDGSCGRHVRCSGFCHPSASLSIKDALAVAITQANRMPLCGKFNFVIQ